LSTSIRQSGTICSSVASNSSFAVENFQRVRELASTCCSFSTSSHNYNKNQKVNFDVCYMRMYARYFLSSFVYPVPRPTNTQYSILILHPRATPNTQSARLSEVAPVASLYLVARRSNSAACWEACFLRVSVGVFNLGIRVGERERRKNAPKSRCWASLAANFFLSAAISWDWSSDAEPFERD
jgi:hypothetical protein